MVPKKTHLVPNKTKDLCLYENEEHSLRCENVFIKIDEVRAKENAYK